MMRTRAGFALVETLTAVVVMTLILIAVARNTSSSQRASQLITSHNVLTTTVVRAIDTVHRDLAYGALSTCRAIPTGEQGLVPAREGASYDNFSWAPVIDVLSTGYVFGPAVSVALQVEPGEPIDGIDNDEDGIVDERRLVRTQAGATTTLLSGVTDLSFTMSGGQVAIALRAAAGGTNGVVVKNLSIATTMRND
jgi:type II secretory pathway component PulJ